ncbi:hypothetical protein V2J09_014575 [Rumex salicifolius]
MFWKLGSLSASSPVDAVLDKDNFSLEELLEEEEIIQECKALNSRLINFVRDRTQVERLLQYIIEDPSEDADSRRIFRKQHNNQITQQKQGIIMQFELLPLFPFVACEIFACEIDVILRTLVEDEELMDLLFSFLNPNRHHSPLLAGYFSKVVVSLMLRKTVPLMNYVEAHQHVISQLVDLIGITSIMEVLVRLVGADDHVYPSYLDVVQWLSDSNLLEMIVDKLSSSSPPEVQANAAETLCAITRNAGSSLATKLSSPSFVSRILGHALEASDSRSGLVQSLSVCISLLDPRKSVSSWIHSVRIQHMYEAPITVHVDTVNAMLPKLGDLLFLLNVSTDDKVLPMPYGELRPPLGKHRLKIVEFIAVLLKAGNVAAEEEMVKSGTIKRVLELFFEYPYNNALHHHVESIVFSCMEGKNDNVIDHLFKECGLISKILQADAHPMLSCDSNQPTKPASGKNLPRAGNIGHITRISNKILQLGQNNKLIQSYIQENGEWIEWQTSVLQERNRVWNVYRWDCGRPTALLDRTRDSDDDILHSRDYDIPAMASNMSQDNGAVERDDEDVYFDDDSAEVVISSLRLGDDQGSLFTNSNWFTFRDESLDDTATSAALSDKIDVINLNENRGDSSSDDEVVVGEDDELIDTKDYNSPFQTPIFNTIDTEVGPTQFEDPREQDLNPLHSPVVGSSENGFPSPVDSEASRAHVDTSKMITTATSLFEEDVEFVGVEPEGTEKAMDQALKEGIVGEAGPMKRNPNSSVDENAPADDSSAGMKEYNDANYWRVDQEVAVLE